MYIESFEFHILLIAIAIFVIYRTNKEFNQLHEIIKSRENALRSKDKIIKWQLKIIRRQNISHIEIKDGDMITNNVDQRRIT